MFLIFDSYNIQRNVRFEWCRNQNTSKFLPFDIVIEDKKIIIEIDGCQHFIEVNFFMTTNVEITQNRDLYKMKQAFANGYKVIRMMQIEVFQEKIKWRDILRRYLDDGFSDNCVFIELKNRYNVYREKMINIHLITLDNEKVEEVVRVEEVGEVIEVGASVGAGSSAIGSSAVVGIVRIDEVKE